MIRYLTMGLKKDECTDTGSSRLHGKIGLHTAIEAMVGSLIYKVNVFFDHLHRFFATELAYPSASNAVVNSS